MEATLVTCTAPGVFRLDQLFETRVSALKNALEPERFIF
jgi:hypothetical protein